jgi:hypothetical protein
LSLASTVKSRWSNAPNACRADERDDGRVLVGAGVAVAVIRGDPFR